MALSKEDCITSVVTMTMLQNLIPERWISKNLKMCIFVNCFVFEQRKKTLNKKWNNILHLVSDYEKFGYNRINSKISRTGLTFEGSFNFTESLLSIMNPKHSSQVYQP